MHERLRRGLAVDVCELGLTTTTGNNNTAAGFEALGFNTAGNNNTRQRCFCARANNHHRQQQHSHRF